MMMTFRARIHLSFSFSKKVVVEGNHSIPSEVEPFKDSPGRYLVTFHPRSMNSDDITAFVTFNGVPVSKSPFNIKNPSVDPKTKDASSVVADETSSDADDDDCEESDLSMIEEMEEEESDEGTTQCFPEACFCWSRSVNV